MKSVLKLCHHAEVPTPASYRPEKIRIDVLTGFDLPAVHGHHLGRYQVVARCAVFWHQLALSAAECQPGDSYCGASAHRRSQAEALRCFVQLAHQTTGVRTR